MQTELAELVGTLLENDVHQSSSISVVPFTQDSHFEGVYSDLLASLVPLNPYYTPYLCPLVSQYCDQLLSVLKTRYPNGQFSSHLNTSLLEFVDTFLGKFGRDTMQYFNSFLATADAFRCKKAFGALFPGVNGLLAKLQEVAVVKSVLSIDSYASLLQPLYMSFRTFLKELKAKFESYVAESTFYHLFIMNDTICGTLSTEGIFQPVKLTPAPWEVDTSPPAIYTQDSVEMALNVQLEQGTAIGETAKIGFIAFMVNNLAVIYQSFAENVLKLANETPIPQVTNYAASSESVTSIDVKRTGKIHHFLGTVKQTLTKKKRPEEEKSQQDPMSFLSSDSDISSNELKYPVDVLVMKTKMQATAIRELHDRSLLLLRGDVRTRCVSFLGHIKGNEYWRETELSDAEGFIGQLSKELQTYHMAVKHILTQKQQEYVWAGVPALMAELLINNISGIKGNAITKQGVRVYALNVKVLQTELAQAEIPGFSTQSSHFHRVTEYLNLIFMNDRALTQVIKEKPGIYTAKQWDVLMALRTPNRPGGLQEQLRKVVRDIVGRDS